VTLTPGAPTLGRGTDLGGAIRNGRGEVLRGYAVAMLRPHRFVGRYAEVKVRRFGPLAVGGPWRREDGKAYGITIYAPANWVWPIQWRRMK
jgi:hypothetical protein